MDKQRGLNEINISCNVQEKQDQSQRSFASMLPLPRPLLYRPPYGYFSQKQVSALEQLCADGAGCIFLLWPQEGNGEPPVTEMPHHQQQQLQQTINSTTPALQPVLAYMYNTHFNCAALLLLLSLHVYLHF